MILELAVLRSVWGQLAILITRQVKFGQLTGFEY